MFFRPHCTPTPSIKHAEIPFTLLATAWGPPRPKYPPPPLVKCDLFWRLRSPRDWFCWSWEYLPRKCGRGREGDQAEGGQWNVALQLLKAFVCQQDRQYVGYKTNDFHFQHWNVPLTTHSLSEMVSYGWLRANRMQLHKSPPLSAKLAHSTVPCFPLFRDPNSRLDSKQHIFSGATGVLYGKNRYIAPPISISKTVYYRSKI